MKLFYLFFRFVTYPIGFLPLSWIHCLGRWLGSLVYYCVPLYRKRCLSNLALATDLHLSNSQIRQIAKESLQNAAICFLEYAKLIRIKDIQEIAEVVDWHVFDETLASGKGCVIFCGHQANWEVLFLIGTSRHAGVAIGRPIKNKFLYKFVLAVREKFGGKIIPPQKAIREGMKAIKNGAFLGVVGDHAMTRSGMPSLFLGRKAWTSPICAVLAYRMQVPLLVATTCRVNDRYLVKFSEAILPDTTKPMEAEVNRMMQEALSIFENSVKEKPGQWFWQHNRWKQETHKRLKKSWRHDCVAVVVPENAQEFFADVMALRAKYPNIFFTLFLPKAAKDFNLPGVEVIIYETLADILIEDYRFKIIFDLTSNPKIKKHFLALAAMKVASREETKKFLVQD